MSGRSTANTARKIPCPDCGVPRFEYCVSAEGSPIVRSHPARVTAARGAPDITPGQLEMLCKLHADPTRHIDPIQRKWLLARGLIESPDPPTPPGRCTRPKRRHPLTELGRHAIGVARADRNAS